ncbi:MAG: hypothetical protein F4Z17_03645 [Acidimicrobiia bacterium]|nr:hypothetical protein [Acidimicrobiia bacterium]
MGGSRVKAMIVAGGGIGLILILLLMVRGPSVSGTITYRERIPLSPGAVVKISLNDTSYADGPSELVAHHTITDPGQVPIDFRVPYPWEAINSRNTYSISVRIEGEDGRLAFINDTAYDVITHGNPNRVDLVLVMVEPPPEVVDGEWNPSDNAPIEQPVDVAETHMIWEGTQALVRVVYRVAATDGCYRLGREEATVEGRIVDVTVTAWVPAPTPWAMDCSDRSLELDSILDLGHSLKTGQTYTVRVNGKTSLTFRAP